MLSQDEFSLVIRSSDCVNYFPDNTPSDFYVRLPHKIDLQSDWCVSVTEIWLTKRWYNIGDTYIAISLSGGEYEEWSVQSGYYVDNQWLVTELNKVANNVSVGCIKFTYDELNHRLYARAQSGVSFKLSPSMCDMLGHVCSEPITGSWVSPNSMDVCSGDRFVYVHSDIVGGQVFSDDILPIIKILDTTNYDFGSIIHDNNINMYIPVVKKMFDVIHIELRDSSNGIIKFEGGVAIVQLHFRRR